MKYLLILISAAIGAFDIRYAIVMFKQQKYGFFGWLIMMAIWMAAMLFNIVFTM